GQNQIAARPLDRRSKRQRTSDLYLQRPYVPVAGELQRIQVRPQQAGSLPLVGAGPVDQPPPGRLKVDMQVDEQRRGSPDEVGAGPASRQLRQMREIRQLTDHDACRLVRVVVRQRADAGRCAAAPRVGHTLRPYRPQDADGWLASLTVRTVVLIVAGMAKGDATRETILHHGVETAARVGLSGLTIGELASATGMSKSGLFAHAKSKEALQLQVLAHAREEFIDAVIRPALAAPRGEPRVR